MAEVSCTDYLPVGWVIVDEEKWMVAVVMHKAPATLKGRIKHISAELALNCYGVKREEEEK